jgi:hypothetical protein
MILQNFSYTANYQTEGMRIKCSILNEVLFDVSAFSQYFQKTQKLSLFTFLYIIQSQLYYRVSGITFLVPYLYPHSPFTTLKNQIPNTLTV